MSNNAIILSIGDEILYGHTVDTNSAWMGQELNLYGINIIEKRAIGDDKEYILQTLDEVKNRADIILITGGLGPTKDDLTKDTLTEYFNTQLVFDENIYAHIKELFSGRGIALLDRNRMQAEVPEACIPIHNQYGTAPGMWFEKDRKIYVSMPGVPHEMKAMMQSFVIPKLREKLELPVIIHEHILTVGIRESILAEKLENYEASLPTHIKLAYLPSLSAVKLRLTAKGTDRALLEDEIRERVAEVNALIPEYIYAFGSDQLEMVTLELLKEKKAKVAIAESCTGGYIAHRFTSVPGSSAAFDGGVVTYSNEVKQNELGVRKFTLEEFGAVSEETVKEMMQGVIRKFGSKYGIAVSGIAGPGGGTAEKPVGLVWIAVGTADNVVTKKYIFKGDRQQNIELSGVTAINMLRKFLKGQLV